MYVIEEIKLENGMSIATTPQACPESPREWDNLGHMIAWMRRCDSPDDNPYEDPHEFRFEMLLEHFTEEELEAAAASEAFPMLDLRVDGKGAKHLWTKRCRPMPQEEPDAAWELVEDYEEWGGSYDLADALAQCEPCVELLSSRMAILPVYRMEHSMVSYSTQDFGDVWDSGQVGYIYADLGDAERFYGKPDAPWFHGEGRQAVLDELRSEVEAYSDWANGDVVDVAVLDADGLEVERACDVYPGSLDGVVEDFKEQYGAKAA